MKQKVIEECFINETTTLATNFPKTFAEYQAPKKNYPVVYMIDDSRGLTIAEFPADMLEQAIEFIEKNPGCTIRPYHHNDELYDQEKAKRRHLKRLGVIKWR